MMYAKIIIDLSAQALDRVFTYRIPDGMNILPGQQVTVPFGPRHVSGFVISTDDASDVPPEKLKDIIAPAEETPMILPELLELSEWMHLRYLCNLVDALRLMLPSALRRGDVRVRTYRTAHLLWNEAQVGEYAGKNRRAVRRIEILKTLLPGDLPAAELDNAALNALVSLGAVEILSNESRRVPALLRDGSRTSDFPLTPDQQKAADAVEKSMDEGGGRFLLYGVTGSGKTEVYIRAIRHALRNERTAIVLVPEIALTPQMVSWFHGRFGDAAAVLHSALSEGERYDEWRRIRSGEAKVVIGARSAVFAPLNDIGVIIIDEEHETSYISDSRPRYDAREVAERRAKMNGAALVLGSATPSVASFMRTQAGVREENKLTLLEMPERVKGRALPQVKVIDMRTELEKGNNSVLSAPLLRGLAQCLENREQAMLFINRRGYSSFVSCRKCGQAVKCEQCDVSMTYHKDDDLLHCHYCGATKARPSVCPSCGSVAVKFFGAGTQKVAEEVRRLLPEAGILRMDTDTTSGKDAHEKILSAFRRGEADILIGTQMIAKGLDFPNVTLVGIVAADLTLNLPDYRSRERTFQLITQMAGRAGRAEKRGHVIVQTYSPESYAVETAARQDYRAFYHRESAYRRIALYPPFTSIMRIVYSGHDAEKVASASREDAEEMREWLDASGQTRETVLLREDKAPIQLLRGEARRQLLLKMYFKGDLAAAEKKLLELTEKERPGVRAELEVNPVAMI